MRISKIIVEADCGAYYIQAFEDAIILARCQPECIKEVILLFNDREYPIKEYGKPVKTLSEALKPITFKLVCYKRDH